MEDAGDEHDQQKTRNALAILRATRLIGVKPIGFQYWRLPQIRREMKERGDPDICSLQHPTP